MTTGPEPGGACPRCGAAYDAGQEYCLECGRRLPVPGDVGSSVGAVWERRVGRRPAPWIWPVLVGLVIAAVMTGVSILVARGADGEASDTIVATDGSGLTSPTTETIVETTVDTETETAETETEPPPTTTQRREELVEWPPSQSGYTVVIASIPTGTGRAQAIRKAREARRSGLREVGVIDSSEFSSLHPGYYVVFSGIHGQQRDALRAAPRVQSLYPAAYVRQISR
ncbi:MAG TPA: zinc ribbon domain-containing protein [Gaiellaceae bacterium]|nr:zinc ribbon domain-containing protein [Gaiellaceae bacterium]